MDFEEIITRITKINDFPILSRLIFVDCFFGEEIEAITDPETKKLIKINMILIKTLADKGMKSHAHMLSQEYYSSEDLDGDGLIYGIDWRYDDPPPVLEGIPIDPKIDDIRKWVNIR